MVKGTTPPSKEASQHQAKEIVKSQPVKGTTSQHQQASSQERIARKSRTNPQQKDITKEDKPLLLTDTHSQHIKKKHVAGGGKATEPPQDVTISESSKQLVITKNEKGFAPEQRDLLHNKKYDKVDEFSKVENRNSAPQVFQNKSKVDSSFRATDAVPRNKAEGEFVKEKMDLKLEQKLCQSEMTPSSTEMRQPPCWDDVLNAIDDLKSKSKNKVSVHQQQMHIPFEQASKAESIKSSNTLGEKSEQTGGRVSSMKYENKTIAILMDSKQPASWDELLKAIDDLKHKSEKTAVVQEHCTQAPTKQSSKSKVTNESTQDLKKRDNAKTSLLPKNVDSRSEQRHHEAIICSNEVRQAFTWDDVLEGIEILKPKSKTKASHGVHVSDTSSHETNIMARERADQVENQRNADTGQTIKSEKGIDELNAVSKECVGSNFQQKTHEKVPDSKESKQPLCWDGVLKEMDILKPKHKAGEKSVHGHTKIPSEKSPKSNEIVQSSTVSMEKATQEKVDSFSKHAYIDGNQNDQGILLTPSSEKEFETYPLVTTVNASTSTTDFLISSEELKKSSIYSTKSAESLTKKSSTYSTKSTESLAKKSSTTQSSKSAESLAENGSQKYSFVRTYWRKIADFIKDNFVVRKREAAHEINEAKELESSVLQFHWTKLTDVATGKEENIYEKTNDLTPIDSQEGRSSKPDLEMEPSHEMPDKKSVVEEVKKQNFVSVYWKKISDYIKENMTVRKREAPHNGIRGTGFESSIFHFRWNKITESAGASTEIGHPIIQEEESEMKPVSSEEKCIDKSDLQTDSTNEIDAVKSKEFLVEESSKKENVLSVCWKRMAEFVRDKMKAKKQEASHQISDRKSESEIEFSIFRFYWIRLVGCIEGFIKGRKRKTYHATDEETAKMIQSGDQIQIAGKEQWKKKLAELSEDKKKYRSRQKYHHQDRPSLVVDSSIMRFHWNKLTGSMGSKMKETQDKTQDEDAYIKHSIEKQPFVKQCLEKLAVLFEDRSKPRTRETHESVTSAQPKIESTIVRFRWKRTAKTVITDKNSLDTENSVQNEAALSESSVEESENEATHEQNDANEITNYNEEEINRNRHSSHFKQSIHKGVSHAIIETMNTELEESCIKKYFKNFMKCIRNQRKIAPAPT